MIRAITALTLAAGMCLSSAAFAAPVPRSPAPRTQVMHNTKLAHLKSVKKSTLMKRQPRVGVIRINRHPPLPNTQWRPLPLRRADLQRVK
jgi:hypothetical protein